MGPTVHKSLQEAIQRTGYISDRSTCAENTSATGSGIKSANLGKKAQFTITSRDSQSRQRKRGGDVYAVKLNKEEYEVKVDVIDKDDGTYLAEYTVPEQDYLSLILSFLVGGGGGQVGTHCPCACEVLTSKAALLLYKLHGVLPRVGEKADFPRTLI